MPGDPKGLRNRAILKDRRDQAFTDYIEGVPPLQIAAKLGITVRQVRHLVNTALGEYPVNLTPDEIARRRQESEARVMRSMQKVIEAQKAAAVDLNHDDPKVRNAAQIAIGALHGRLMNSEERLAELYGLNQPLKIVEESMRFEYKKIDGKIEVVFDRDQLRPTGEPIGLVDCDGEPYELPYDPHQSD
jgi:hypothetical protein